MARQEELEEKFNRPGQGQKEKVFLWLPECLRVSCKQFPSLRPGAAQGEMRSLRAP